MRLYLHQTMMNKVKKGDVVGAKKQILNHLEDYIFMVNGHGAEVGAAIPEVTVYGMTFPEIKLISEKKDFPIIFNHNKELFNLLGINEGYGYFIKMDNHLANPPIIEYKEKFTFTKAIVSFMNTLLGKDEHSSVSPVSDETKERVISNGITHDFKVCKYWFRRNFGYNISCLKIPYDFVEVEDLITYRLLNGQNSRGASIPLLDKDAVNIYSIGNRDGLEAYGIPLRDLGIGALYSVAELTAKERMA